MAQEPERRSPVSRLGRLWQNILLFAAAMEMTDADFLEWRLSWLEMTSARRNGTDGAHPDG
jgi:hypothetical protein